MKILSNDDSPSLHVLIFSFWSFSCTELRLCSNAYFLMIFSILNLILSLTVVNFFCCWVFCFCSSYWNSILRPASSIEAFLTSNTLDALSLQSFTFFITWSCLKTRPFYCNLICVYDCFVILLDRFLTAQYCNWLINSFYLFCSSRAFSSHIFCISGNICLNELEKH